MSSRQEAFAFRLEDGGQLRMLLRDQGALPERTSRHARQQTALLRRFFLSPLLHVTLAFPIQQVRLQCLDTLELLPVVFDAPEAEQGRAPPRRKAVAEQQGEGGWWLGGGSSDSLDGDALRVHLLPEPEAGGAGGPPPQQPGGGEPGGPCLSAPYASDFLPSVLEDREDRPAEGPPVACTKHELRAAVSALIALNRSQWESFQALRDQWTIRHFELGGRISRLEASLRLHQTVLSELVACMQRGRSAAVSWRDLQVLLSQLPPGLETACSSSSSSRLSEEEAACEARGLLSDAPAEWTTKLLDWSTRVDCLPIAGAGMCAQPHASKAEKEKEGEEEEKEEEEEEEGEEDSGSSECSYSGGEAAAASAAAAAAGAAAASALADLQRQKEGEGLQLHVMGVGGAELSAAAESDALLFKAFVANASLRQEAWLETFSSFAGTAVPAEALLQADSLQLQLLDEAVTLPETDMLLLVAESLLPAGCCRQTHKEGMRVLGLLERSVAARCFVKSRNLRRGAVVEVCDFEPFCAVIQPTDPDTSSSSSSSSGSSNGNSSSNRRSRSNGCLQRRKVLTIPICSLQKIRLKRGPPSTGDEGGSPRAPSGSPGDSKGGCSVSTPQGAAAGGSQPAGSCCSGSSRQREGDGGEAGPPSSSGGPRESVCCREETTGPLPQTPNGLKRRKTGECEVEREQQQEPQPLEEQTRRGPLQERQRAGGGCRSLHQSSAEGHFMRGAPEAVTEQQARPPKQQQQQQQQENSTADQRSRGRQEEGGTRAEAAGRAAELPSNASLHANLRSRGVREAGPRAASEAAACADIPAPAARAAAATAAAATAATAAAAAPAGGEGARRGGAAASIRCSGQAAQQQLQQQRQQLPRARGTVSRELLQQLPAFDCPDCAAFFGLVGKEAVGREVTCKHARGQQETQQPSCSSTRGEPETATAAAAAAAAAAADNRMWSRHRQLAPPPSTPPGYWDL
ncbi:hypothetical protein Efla_004455 [Eimeria flavescens]